MHKVIRSASWGLVSAIIFGLAVAGVTWIGRHVSLEAAMAVIVSPIVVLAVYLCGDLIRRYFEDDWY